MIPYFKLAFPMKRYKSLIFLGNIETIKSKISSAYKKYIQTTEKIHINIEKIHSIFFVKI